MVQISLVWLENSPSKKSQREFLLSNAFESISQISIRFLDKMGKKYPRTGTVVQDFCEFMDPVYQAMPIPDLCPTLDDYALFLEQSINSLQDSTPHVQEARY